jgi:type IV pilus assembly protein PilE
MQEKKSSLAREGHHGFTLIELMIVLVIVAILAAVALPSYQQYVIRTNQGAAKAFLVQIATRETQYLIDNRSSYKNAANSAEIKTALGLSPQAEIESVFGFSIATFSKGSGAVAPPGFRAVAVPTAKRGGVFCFSIDDDGARKMGQGSVCADNTATDTW